MEARQPPGQLTAVMADAAYGSGILLTDVWGRQALPIIDYNH